jgi:hypothetical protein
MRAKLRAAAPMLILGAGFALFLFYAFPGYTSSDSIVQLEQARSHQFTDWHPPAMAALWGIVDLIVRGPAGMLLLQGGLVLLGLYRIARRDLSDRSAAIVASAILLFPPILAPMAVIWKDSQMAGFLVMGASLVLERRASRQWIGVGLLLLGTAMRDNAPAATLPMFIYLFVVARRDSARTWRRVVLALTVWLLTVATAMTVNRALTRVESHAWHCSLAPADIVGVLRTAPKYSDAELEQIFEGTALVAHENIWSLAHDIYTPRNWWPTANGKQRMFNWPETKGHRDSIARAWRTLVLDHPLDYLRHRVRVFREVLGLSKAPVFDPVWNYRMTMAQEGVPDADRAPQVAIGDGLKWLAAHTILFRPYLYFLLALLFLPLLRRHSDLLMLVASGLGYELTLLPFASTPDFRYSHWTITCTVTVTLILIKRRSAASSSESQ